MYEDKFNVNVADINELQHGYCTTSSLSFLDWP